MVPGLPDATGRSEIRELLERRLGSARVTNFAVTRREIDVAADAVHELAWFAETVHHGQNEAMRMEGHYLTVWRRRSDGAWRVHRHFYNYSSAKPVSS